MRADSGIFGCYAVSVGEYLARNVERIAVLGVKLVRLGHVLDVPDFISWQDPRSFSSL